MAYMPTPFVNYPEVIPRRETVTLHKLMMPVLPAMYASSRSNRALRYSVNHTEWAHSVVR